MRPMHGLHVVWRRLGLTAGQTKTTHNASSLETMKKSLTLMLQPRMPQPRMLQPLMAHGMQPLINEPHLASALNPGPWYSRAPPGLQP